MPIDTTAATELKLFTDNDGDIYRQQTTSILKNLATKKGQGKYDRDLAVKLFMYLAENGAKKYAKEFGGTWNLLFPKDVREHVSKEWRDEFETEFDLGNYDHLIPKKYQNLVKAGTHLTLAKDGGVNEEIRGAQAKLLKVISPTSFKVQILSGPAKGSTYQIHSTEVASFKK